MALCVQHFRMSAAAAAMRTWLARALERRRLGALLRTAATRVSLGLTQPFTPAPTPALTLTLTLTRTLTLTLTRTRTLTLTLTLTCC